MNAHEFIEAATEFWRESSPHYVEFAHEMVQPSIAVLVFISFKPITPAWWGDGERVDARIMSLDGREERWWECPDNVYYVKSRRVTGHQAFNSLFDAAEAQRKWIKAQGDDYSPICACDDCQSPIWQKIDTLVNRNNHIKQMFPF